MSLTKLAIFLHFKTILRYPLVLRRRVISLLAFATCKYHIISHFNKPAFTKMEPTTRIELVTSSLPRMCSTN